MRFEGDGHAVIGDGRRRMPPPWQCFAVAVVLLAVALSLFTGSIVMSSRAVDSGRDQLLAMNYARAEMERLRTLAFNDPEMTPGTYPISNDTYSGTITIASVPGIPNPMKSVSVRVNWRNASIGKSTNMQFSTVFSEALH